MAKFPFTPQGVQDMQAELYALPDDQLRAIAETIRTHFSGWVLDTFELDSGQQQFFGGLSPLFIRSSADSTSLAVANRLPIILVKPEVSLRTEKLIRKKNNLTDGSNGSGDYEASGGAGV